MKHKLIKHLHTFKHLRYLDLPSDVRPILFYKIIAGIAKSCQKVEYIRLRDPAPDFIETALAVESLKELDVIIYKLKSREERLNKMTRNLKVEIPFYTRYFNELLYKWKRGSNQKLFVLECHN